jgi:hypothetical protein
VSSIVGVLGTVRDGTWCPVSRPTGVKIGVAHQSGHDVRAQRFFWGGEPRSGKGQLPGPSAATGAILIIDLNCGGATWGSTPTSIDTVEMVGDDVQGTA